MELVFYAVTAVLFGLGQVSAVNQCSSEQKCTPLRFCPKLRTLFNQQDLTRAHIKNFDEQYGCDSDDPFSNTVCCPPVKTTPTRPIGSVCEASSVEPIVHQVSHLQSNLLPTKCGSSSRRVFGGTEIEIGSYQWMALLNYGTKSSPKWYCGGSLISDRYVVTAAHCADPKFTNRNKITQVRLGEHNIRKDKDCKELARNRKLCAPPVQDFSPEEILIHPNWNKCVQYSNDIALIRLDQKASISGFVLPICLPQPDLNIANFLNGRYASVAGWGRTEGGVSSEVKLKVDVPFVDLERCRADYSSTELLDKGQICFGGEIGKDSCKGDSGGSLSAEDFDSQSSNLITLLGIVSYGSENCGSNLPAVYTEVSQYRSWIISNLKT